MNGFSVEQQQAALNFFHHGGANDVLMLLEVSGLFNAFVQVINLPTDFHCVIKHRLEDLKARRRSLSSPPTP